MIKNTYFDKITFHGDKTKLSNLFATFLILYLNYIWILKFYKIEV